MQAEIFAGTRRKFPEKVAKEKAATEKQELAVVADVEYVHQAYSRLLLVLQLTGIPANIVLFL